MLTSYGTGSAENRMCARSRICQPGVKPGIQFCHGHNGTALGLVGLETGGGANWKPITNTLQDLNCPILMADLAGDNWGNDAGQSALTSAKADAQSTFGAKTGKVILIGGSMGGLVSLNWGRANPTLVAAVVLLYPCVNLQAQHDGTGGATSYASFIETAYGGLAGYNAALATHDPSKNMAAYTDAFPIRVYYSTADDQVGVTPVTDFISGVGGSQISSVSLGAASHFDTSKIPLGDLNAWLAQYL